MMFRTIAAAVFLLVSWTWALSQSGEGSPQILGAEVIGAGTAGEELQTYDILVVGDALGGGLGAGLGRIVEGEEGYTVSNRFNEASGIARPEVYDWSATLPKIMESRPYRAVVVLVGSNDRQEIRKDSSRLAFGTPEWRDAYRAKTDAVLDALLQARSGIFWVSIPPMADPQYDADMRLIADLQKERVTAKGAIFVDIRPAFLTADGAYTDTGPDDTGDVRKLRSSDGVNFFKQGNNRMGQIVLEAIKAFRESGGGAAGATIGADGTIELPPPSPIPVFGQSIEDTASVTYIPVDVTLADLVGFADGSSEMKKAADIMSALRSIAAEGSDAEKLFSTGEPLPAPPGRVDSYVTSTEPQ